MAKAAARRPRGMIRRRGNSFQVIVFARYDPLTGRELRLRESTTDEAESRRILRRLTAPGRRAAAREDQGVVPYGDGSLVADARGRGDHPASYEQYARVHLYPAFGDEPIGKVSTRILEEFYAELRRCNARCDGWPYVEHRTGEPHDCRTVKHRRPARPAP